MVRHIPDPLRTVSVKLPRSLDSRLTAIARRRRTTRSAVIRELVASLADESRDSVLERMGDLVGSFSGPRDLSTNPKYMKDFGKDRRR